MRRLIIGNWKAHNETRRDVIAFVDGLRKHLQSHHHSFDLGIAPSDVNLRITAEALEGTEVLVGAQDVDRDEPGSYTGQSTVGAVVDAGATFVILGHSELRSYKGETNRGVNRKIKMCLRHSLVAVACLGENAAERSAGQSKEVIAKDLTEMLNDVGLDGSSTDHLVIAYEPVWAIKRSKDDISTQAATPQDVADMHAYIAQLLAKIYDAEAAREIRVAYGGSVNPENAGSFFAHPAIGGLLVGTASVNFDSFRRILDAAESAVGPGNRKHHFGSSTHAPSAID